MTCGIILVLAAASLFCWNIYKDKQAEKSAQEILAKLIEQVESIPEGRRSTGTEMKTAEIDGYEYIGYLSIPALGIELPVMSEWDYNRLTIAPCRYTGSTKTDDLVIAAHNYTSHFRPLWHIPVGETVIFTDMEGVRNTYEVADVQTLSPTSVKDMTDSEYALTLFTCNYGGSARVTVRCSRANLYE